jgi:hypothetical protein
MWAEYQKVLDRELDAWGRAVEQALRERSGLAGRPVDPDTVPIEPEEE